MFSRQLELLAEQTAEYHVKHPCTTNYGRDSGCVKGLDTPLTSQLRTFSECYECQRAIIEDYLKGKKNENRNGN